MQNYTLNKELIKQVRLELFAEGDFDFIVERLDEKTGELKVHDKQRQALEILTDDSTVEFCYGGAAGGGKTFLGCVWLMFLCLLYPETRWFIGRDELKKIKQSTLVTFFKVGKQYGFSDEFTYNGQDNAIIFKNGSKIDLLDLKYLPRDPLFERFGSTEYTGGFIEEAAEVEKAAFEILKVRIGRHLNEKYGLKKKLFLTANPNKNWIKESFYDLLKNYSLPEYRMFLQCLVHENPFAPEDYIEGLETLEDEVTKQRLLYGNWEYADDPLTLLEYEYIEACFDNDWITKGDKWITADIALDGSDLFVIGVWFGLRLESVYAYEKTNGKEIYEAIKSIQRLHNIRGNRIIYDADGIGGFIGGYIPSAIGFKNGSKALGKDDNYKNLKTQCEYKLRDKIGEIYIAETEHSERIKKELSIIRKKPTPRDGKLETNNKAERKRLNGGKSPDFSDMITMRMYPFVRSLGKRRIAKFN